MLKDYQSNVTTGQAWTILNFHPNTDMKKAYTQVLARLNQIPEWPAQVQKPRVIDYSRDAGSTLASLFLYSESEITEEELVLAYRSYVEPSLSKISGIEQINLDSNRAEQRIDIEFYPEKLALYSLTLEHVATRLSRLADSSGGGLEFGTREYRLLFRGQSQFEELEDLAIGISEQKIIRLKEVAKVHKRFAFDWSYSAFKGHKAMYFYIQPASSINALEVLQSLKAAVSEMNEGPLSNTGIKLALSRDNSISIKNALWLVYGSIAIGVILACCVLYCFLRSFRSLFLIFISIPVCLAIVLLLMFLCERSLNLISLAGMALSIGLLLDTSIILVENIQRLRSEGLETINAIHVGTSQVTGALVSSTLSSILIFAPILLINTNASNLFEDLAFTVSSALLASLLVAIILIPAFARYMLKDEFVDKSTESKLNGWENFVCAPSRKRVLAIIWVVLAVPGALIMVWLSSPQLDLLPDPKEELVMVYIAFDEPKSVLSAKNQVGRVIDSRIEEQKHLLGSPNFEIHGQFCSPTYCLLFFYPEGIWNLDEFRKWIEAQLVGDLVGVNAFVYQGSLLRLAMPDSRSSQLDLKGADLATLQSTGTTLLQRLKLTFPEARITELVPFGNTLPSIEFYPNNDKLAFYGININELNSQLVTLTGGRYLGRFYSGGDSLPFYFKGKEPEHLHELLETELVFPEHGPVPLRELVSTNIILSPGSLYRTNGLASVSLNLIPPEGMPIGLFVERVKKEVSQFIINHKEIYVEYRGSADSLSVFLDEFGKMFLVALVGLLLLMRLTLSSWSLALSVLLSMPLALAGGMLSLNLLNLWVPQNLDVITLIGFMILMGLVINNAILFASHFEQAIFEGKERIGAIESAVKSRIRSIYMSTLTSILGMLPLVLNPGVGAEIYRGLATVIVGGMTFSALFTLSFMAAILSCRSFCVKLCPDEANLH
ncbi:efflux RND transporter permease subunit [Pseudoalteromonas xiamenensis]|uniref:Efflux RND transporter permease subunit n=1 Tax=Pseudoalteromonas xiamenensis TaxID=882626 RepID=A0A975HMD7_9GAMM|nr:efflux RND transporter permease subunit [Pseudoalteromonas xiamenensis]QTH73028.1 efflux RND transporter permease subunit [Pseudoalteromonas xiamenensis]